MHLKDVLNGIQIVETNADLDTDIADISYDSRTVTSGNLFVAIKGTVSDGHKFIPSAVEKGAAVILCEDKPQIEIPYVLVADSRLALALASSNYFGRPSEKMTMIGVTGTNGKTTTTYLIKHILESQSGSKVGLIGTNCNMIGSEELPTERTTPESYEIQKLFYDMYNAGCTHVVMEVSSHSLVLERVAGIHFAIGIFTNLTQDHLDFHKDMEDYALAKSLMFRVCDTGIINLDDNYGKFMLEHANCSVKTISLKDSQADYYASDVILSPSGVDFTMQHQKESLRILLGIPGRFSVYNATGVIAACCELGVGLKDCAKGLKTAHGVKGRVETVPTDGNYTILIDYSHTPDALENVLKTVRETCTGRVVVLFGCGGDRDRKKRPIMGGIGTELSDFAIITSDNPRTENPEEIIQEILAGVKPDSNYIAITDRAKAIEYAIQNHQDGDVIVLAGKGHETYQEVNHVKHHMDEREIVSEIIERRKTQ